MTLEPDVEVLYKTTALYSAAHDRGVAWDDPAIGVAWPSLAGGPVLSDKDRRWPRLKDAAELFEDADRGHRIEGPGGDVPARAHGP